VIAGDNRAQYHLHHPEPRPTAGGHQVADDVDVAEVVLEVRGYVAVPVRICRFPRPRVVVALEALERAAVLLIRAGRNDRSLEDRF